MCDKLLKDNSSQKIQVFFMMFIAKINKSDFPFRKIMLKSSVKKGIKLIVENNVETI